MLFASWGLRRPGKLVLPSDADQDEGCGGERHTSVNAEMSPLAPPHMGFTIGGEMMDG